VALARLVDRVVVALTEGCPGAGVHHYLHEVRVARPALDLARSRLRILVRYSDRTLEYPVVVVLLQPRIREPVVERCSYSGAKVGVGVQVAERARQQHRVSHAVLFYVLLAQEIWVGARRSSVWWCAVEPVDMRRVVEKAAPALLAIPPRHRHMLLDVFCTAGRRMHVTVHDAFANFSRASRTQLAFDHAHASWLLQLSWNALTSILLHSNNPDGANPRKDEMKELGTCVGRLGNPRDGDLSSSPSRFLTKGSGSRAMTAA
jgi:hypothetical protein